MCAWDSSKPTNDGLLINFPAECRANWEAIVLGTDADLLITNAKVAAAAGIVDTKLATISTAGKVLGSSFNTLSGIPSGAGQVPIANLPTITTAKGGTNLTSYSAGDLLYASAANTLSALTKGAAYKVLRMNSGGTLPEWGGALAGFKDYGTSASSSTSREPGIVWICAGKSPSIASSGTQAITNLPFSSSTSYFVTTALNGSGGSANDRIGVTKNSGTQFTLVNNDSNAWPVEWIAIGT